MCEGVRKRLFLIHPIRTPFGQKNSQQSEDCEVCESLLAGNFAKSFIFFLKGHFVVRFTSGFWPIRGRYCRSCRSSKGCLAEKCRKCRQSRHCRADIWHQWRRRRRYSATATRISNSATKTHEHRLLGNTSQVCFIVHFRTKVHTCQGESVRVF